MARNAAVIRTIDLLGVFWRSFFIQASWSYDRLQSLGFAFALIPILRRLYPDREEFTGRLAAHMEYFNTQPYLASFVLGAAARAEEDRASGRNAAADNMELKRTLMAPLGALGDSFFWGSLKPFAASAAVAVLLAGAWWAPLLFLVLYNIAHVGLRLSLVFVGYETGGDVVALMSRYNFTRLARRYKVLSLAIIGCIAGTLSAWGTEFRIPVAVSPSFLAATGLALTLGMIVLLRIGASPVKIMIGLAAACLMLAFGGLA
jgi:mannose/fructose/N-acetylgalactosamine-specific phosphotransferase system component IID